MESQLNTTWRISLVSYVALQCTEHNALRVLHSYFSGAEKLYLSKGVSEYVRETSVTPGQSSTFLDIYKG